MEMRGIAYWFMVLAVASVLGGMVWGIIGMFLSVPITVMLIIILSEIPSTRPIAILLTKDGNILRNKN